MGSTSHHITLSSLGSDTQTHKHTGTHRQTHTDTQTQTQTQTHTHTHTHKHIHARTYIQMFAQKQFCETRRVPVCGWHMPGLKIYKYYWKHYFVLSWMIFVLSHQNWSPLQSVWPDQFWQKRLPKLVPLDYFCCQNLSSWTNFGSQSWSPFANLRRSPCKI